MIITLTPKAVHKATALAQRDGVPAVLRLGIKKGGCAGFSYTVEFCTTVVASDKTFLYGDLTVVCAEDALQHLNGMQLDYESTLMKGGFRFSNPNATKSCGCGESFAVEKSARKLAKAAAKNELKLYQEL